MSSILSSLFKRTAAPTEEERVFCHYPFTSLFITLDGLVRPCCFSSPIGDLHDQDIEEMWNSPVARATRNHLSRGDMDGAGCGGCGFRGRRDIETFPRNPGLGQRQDVADNIRLQNEEYDTDSEALRSFPSYVVVQVTEACNFECTMCFQDHEPVHLETNLLDKVMKHAHQFDEIQFTGGEPFLSKWVQKFLRNFDPACGTKLSFTTNGSLLHKFKEELERLPRVHLGISVDGASSETYEKIRVGAKWAEVSANVEWFSEQRRFHRPLWDTSRLAFVIMKSNYEEIPAFVEWARTLEMPVLFCPVWGEFAPGENIFDHPELCAGLTSTSQIIAKAEGIAEKMPIYERTETIKSLRHSLEKLPH